MAAVACDHDLRKEYCVGAVREVTPLTGGAGEELVRGEPCQDPSGAFARRRPQ
jgi:hypothetical protein